MYAGLMIISQSPGSCSQLLEDNTVTVRRSVLFGDSGLLTVLLYTSLSENIPDDIVIGKGDGCYVDELASNTYRCNKLALVAACVVHVS
jgi:hypothetical protein